jgi:mannosyl-oligosaccharide alpha-1,2-mannosidase
MFPYIPRWWVYCVVALFCFILLAQRQGQSFGRDYIPHRSSSWCPVTPPRTPPVSKHPTKDQISFRWRNLPSKYPIESHTSIPAARSRPLRKIQHKFKSETSHAAAIRKERQAQVKTAFQRGWKSYKEKAWMKDELAPISGGSKDTFGGWGATLVDSLDTLLIMNLKEEFDEAVSAAVSIDFGPETSSLDVINVFETTIRHLGGFLSAYDLTGCKDKRLLNKALELGDMIYASFDTPNHMPIHRWSPQKAAKGEEQSASDAGVLAELASTSLEFTRLSQLTGDMRFYDTIARVTDELDKQQNSTKMPGMWPVEVNIQAPIVTEGNTFSLGAMADSAYEYLPKMYALLGGVGQASQYERLYNYAMNTAINNVLFRPMVPGDNDILMAGIARAYLPSADNPEPTSQHLTCFVGGMLALGGKLMGNTTHVEAGRRVTNGCIWAYKNSPLGIMPEWFAMSSCPSHASCSWNETRWAESSQPNLPFGFTQVSDGRYILRPEAIESVFILYRITGEPAFQEAAWDMFQAIERHTSTEYGNAALKSVMAEDTVKEDSMESFWMAETLKYFYLIFSETDLISLDEFVFNTEAHPLRLGR